MMTAYNQLKEVTGAKKSALVSVANSPDHDNYVGVNFYTANLFKLYYGLKLCTIRAGTDLSGRCL